LRAHVHVSAKIGAALAALAVFAATVTAAAQVQPAPACDARQAGLSGVGRAEVVSFTGAIGGERVCALVANVSAAGVSARIVAGPRGADALVVAAIAPGGGAVLTIRDGGLTVEPAAPGAPQGGEGLSVGPFVVPPGGGFPAADTHDSERMRVVLAYAGSRLVLIQTTPVTIVDLALALRDQPDLFGIDAPERAVLLAGGAGAVMQLRTDAGTLGTAPATAPALELMKRP
jgi:hypothetical protein